MTGDAICAFALDKDGKGYGWGIGADRAVGTINEDDTIDPSIIAPLNGGYSFSSVKGRGRTSAGITSGGDLYVWGGMGASLMLDLTGEASKDYIRTPSKVTLSESVKDVALGDIETDFTEGVSYLSSDGKVYGYGRLPWVSKSFVHTVTELKTDLRFTSLHSFSQGTLGLSEDGHVYFWGLYPLGSSTDDLPDFFKSPTLLV